MTAFRTTKGVDTVQWTPFDGDTEKKYTVTDFSPTIKDFGYWDLSATFTEEFDP
jgi:hypothetical protein